MVRLGRGANGAQTKARVIPGAGQSSIATLTQWRTEQG